MAGKRSKNTSSKGQRRRGDSFHGDNGETKKPRRQNPSSEREQTVSPGRISRGKGNSNQKNYSDREATVSPARRSRSKRGRSEDRRERNENRISARYEEEGDVVSMEVTGLHTDFTEENTDNSTEEDEAVPDQFDSEIDEDSEVNFPSMNRNTNRSDNRRIDEENFEDGEIVEDSAGGLVDNNYKPTVKSKVVVPGPRMITLEDAEKLVNQSVSQTVKKFEELLAAQGNKKIYQQDKPAERSQGKGNEGIVLESPSESTIYQAAVRPEQVQKNSIEAIDSDSDKEKGVDNSPISLNGNELNTRINSSSDEVNTSDELIVTDPIDDNLIKIRNNIVGKQGGGDCEHEDR